MGYLIGIVATLIIVALAKEYQGYSRRKKACERGDFLNWF